MLRKRDLPEFLRPAIGNRTTAVVLWTIAAIVFAVTVVTIMIIAKITPPPRVGVIVGVAVGMEVLFILGFTFGLVSWLEYKDMLYTPYSLLLATADIEPAIIVKMNEAELRGLAVATLCRLANNVKAAEKAHPGDEYHEERIGAKRKFESMFNTTKCLMLIDSGKGYGQFFR